MADKIQVYHNPRCRKSREALTFLSERNIEPEIIEYLKEIPSAEELKKVLAKLNISAEELIRKEEQIYKEKFKGKSFNDDEWIEIMRENPKLIQRPIILNRAKGVIGRPTERITEIL